MITDYYGQTHVMPGPFRTLEQVKRANAATGAHFFSPDSLRYFSSRIAPGVIGGRLIVTSEQDRSVYLAPSERAWGGARRYTVRLIADDGSVQPLQPEDVEDGYGAFPSLGTARTWARHLAAGKARSAVASWASREA